MFKIESLTPLFYQVPNYPVNVCNLCRGQLIDPCNDCIDSNITVCKVINDNKCYYHEHCKKKMDDNKSTK